MPVQIEVDLRNNLGPIRDQGQRSTCLSHATSAAHEHARSSTVPLSPEYLHFFASNGNPDGCTLPEMTAALDTHGQPVETDCPYSPTSRAAGWTPPKGLTVFKHPSFETAPTLGDIELALRTGEVPVLAISMPESFYRPADPWVIPAEGRIRGYHALAGVGFGRHNNEAAVLIRNSWGDAWGDGGHAWLTKSFMDKHLKGILLLN